jgi:hypothetical protein
MNATRKCPRGRRKPPTPDAEPASQDPPPAAGVSDATVHASLLTLVRLLGRQAAREALSDAFELIGSQRSAL